MQIIESKIKSTIFKPTLIAACVAQSLASFPNHAATIEPDNTQDVAQVEIPGTPPTVIEVCSLREAIISMNNGALEPGCTNTGDAFGINDQIISPAALNFPLYSELSITTNDALTIDLAGSTITGAGNHRIIFAGGTPDLTLTNMTVTGGSEIYNGGGIRMVGSTVSIISSTVSNNTVNSAYGPIGAGVFADSSTLTIIDSSISSNTAAPQGKGAGIAMRGAASSLNVSNSTINHNYADAAGGVYQRDGQLTLSNSTISNNAVVSDGGGISLAANATAMLSHTTLYGNSAVRGSSIFSYSETGDFISITLANSIISDELSDQDCLFSSAVGGGSLFVDDGGNWFEDDTCDGTAQGDPGLMPLADNGGPTQTHALKENSIARNTGILGFCPLKDQRGNVRNVRDGKCDAGAYELLNSEIPVNFFTIPLPNGKLVVIPL